MNKSEFLSAFKPRESAIEISGKSIIINELSLAQRGKLHKTVQSDPVRGQALIVCMGCPLFDENSDDDIEAVMSMGDAVAKIADAILSLSGLGDDEKN